VPGSQYQSDTGPFAIVPEWVIDLPVSHPAVRLYALLSRYADYESGDAWPSRSTLARRMGSSTDSIDRWTRELENAGAVTVTRRQVVSEDGNAMNMTNLYQVHRAPQGRRTGAARGIRTDTGRGRGTRAPLTRTRTEQEPHLSVREIGTSQDDRVTEVVEVMVNLICDKYPPRSNEGKYRQTVHDDVVRSHLDTIVDHLKAWPESTARTAAHSIMRRVRP